MEKRNQIYQKNEKDNKMKLKYIYWIYLYLLNDCNNIDINIIFDLLNKRIFKTFKQYII